MIGRAATAGAACVLALTGCSSSSGSGSAGHAAFLASVGAVCQRAVDAHRGHDLPIVDFDPMHPDPAELPTVGEYLATYGDLPVTVGALHALRPPADDAGRWATVLALVDQVAANAQRQVEAARAGDVATFVATVRTGQPLNERLNHAADRLGLRSGSACDQVFG